MKNQEPLKGEELLAFVANWSHLTKQEVAIKAGYVFYTAKGPRAKMLDFYVALIEAQFARDRAARSLAWMAGMSQGPVAGKKLLALVTGYPKLTDEEKACKAGYVRQTGSGERADMTAFYIAVIEAVHVKHSHPKRSKQLHANWPCSFRLLVEADGSIRVGGRYVRRAGFKAGETLQIKMNRSCRELQILPISQNGDS